MTATRRRSARLIVGSVAAGVLLLGGAGATAMTTITHRHDADLAQARSEVASSAADGAVAILSYRPDTVDADVARATTLLTGDFLDYYSSFGRDVVAPAAKDRGITSTVSVSGTSVVSASADDAVALVFVNQNVTSKDAPTPTTGSTSLRIELTRVGDAWLVSKLDPV